MKDSKVNTRPINNYFTKFKAAAGLIIKLYRDN
jgi:hypothetical protein